MKLRPSVILTAAFFAVLAVKAAVFFQLWQHPLLDPAGETDGAYYRHFAEMVARGDIALSAKDSYFGQPPSAFFIAPLYIYVLGLIFKLSGDSVVAARVVQLGLGTAAVFLLAATVRRWYGRTAGWIAGALAAGCGLFSFFEALILPAALDPFLTTVDLWAIGRAADDGGRRQWAVAGAALGLHALNRPHLAIVLAGLTIIMLVVRQGEALRARAIRAAVVLASGLVVIAPVTVRNYAVGGEVIPIASTFGINVLMGNGPDATGVVSAAMNVVPNVSGEWVSAGLVASAALNRPVSARDVSFFFLRRAASWTLRHPVAAARLFVRKVWYTVSATFVTINHAYPFFAKDLRGPLSVLRVGPALFVPLGLLGLVVAAPRGRRGFALWAAFAPLAILSVALVFVASRYRLPFQMALVGSAGGFIAWVIDRVKGGEASRLGAPAVAAAAIAMVVAFPTRLDDGRAEETLRMGLIEIQNGRVAEGEAWLQRALAAQAPPALTHVRAGTVYEASRKFGEAVAHYRQALASNPTEPAIHFVLGRAYFASGDLSAAVRELAGARVGAQQDAASRLLVVALAKAGRVEETNTVIHDLDPRNWELDEARQFAAAIADTGRVDLSIAAWQRAAELSKDARDWERLGLAWAIVGRNAEALQSLAEAVRIDPGTASTHLNYAVTLAEAGRLTEARAEADAALQIDPNYENAKRLIAAIKKQ